MYKWWTRLQRYNGQTCGIRKEKKRNIKMEKLCATTWTSIPPDRPEQNNNCFPSNAKCFFFCFFLLSWNAFTSTLYVSIYAYGHINTYETNTIAFTGPSSFTAIDRITYSVCVHCAAMQLCTKSKHTLRRHWDWQREWKKKQQQNRHQLYCIVSLAKSA